MTKYQLWSRDEYGQGTIFITSEDFAEVEKQAKQEVSSINVHNALTTDDREKNWEAYMVLIEAKCKVYSKYFYSGNNPRNKKDVYGVKKDGSAELISIDDISNPTIRIYLGDVSPKRGQEVEWCARDARGKIIESIDHPDLKSKTIFFITKID